MRASEYIPTLERWKTGYELTKHDLIFDNHGNYNKIIDLKQDKVPIRRFILSDGSKIDVPITQKICIRDVRQSNKNKGFKEILVSDVKKDDLYDKIFGFNTLTIVHPSELKYVNQNLENDPYILGCLIGHAQRDENSEIILKTLEKDGGIPSEYFTGEYKQRIELVSGLSDTLGVFDSNTKKTVLSYNNPILGYHIKVLLSSLGLNSEIKEPANAVKHKYRLLFNSSFNPFIKNENEKNKWFYKDMNMFLSISNFIDLPEDDIIIPIIKNKYFIQTKNFYLGHYE